MFLVDGNDSLNQWMANDIALGEFDESDAFDIFQNATGFEQILHHDIPTRDVLKHGVGIDEIKGFVGKRRKVGARRVMRVRVRDAAQVGGLGMAPGANIGDEIAFFEATHGTAPKYANKDVINPASVMLSGVMMFRHLGWHEAADLVEQGIGASVAQKRVTYDLARQMQGATELKTSQFADAIIENMRAEVRV